MPDWTIQKLLNWITKYLTEKNIDSPRLCAELLLSHVLKKKRIELYTNFDKTATKPQLDRLHDLIKRAAQNEPVQYLTGKTEFYSLQFRISPDCLIPRPETELLVERAIEFLRTRSGPQLVCDLCTGCGCIAIAIAKNFDNARIIATDISNAALSIAGENVETYRLTNRIQLLQGDLFDPIMPQLDTAKFDLVVSNPPYISIADFANLPQNVKQYEPKSALLAGVDGLDIYRRICDKLEYFLKPDAAVIMEIGYDQANAVRELLEQNASFTHIEIEKDLHHNDRIAVAKKIPPNSTTA